MGIRGEKTKRKHPASFFISSTRCLSLKKKKLSLFLSLSPLLLPPPVIRFDATAKAASEAASTADARWRLSAKARAAAVDAKRLYPYYRDKTKKFVATPFGQASAVGALLFLLWTGVLGRLLNLAFLVYWLAPLLLLPLAQAGATRAQREQENQRRRAEEEARRARWGPAADWFGGGGGGSGSGRSKPSSSSSSAEGDIIDVEVD